MFLWTIQWILISAILIVLIHYFYSFFENMLAVPKIKDLVDKSTLRYNDNINNISEYTTNASSSITSASSSTTSTSSSTTNTSIITSASSNSTINVSGANINNQNNNMSNINNSMEIELEQYLQNIKSNQVPQSNSNNLMHIPYQ